MALHRTAVAAAAAGTLIVLAGCDTLSFRRLDYDQTESAKITRITVPAGGAGDVTIRATGAADQVRIKRIVRYQGGEPDTRYEIKGDELVLPSDCGSRCTVSWEVTAPEGVTVRGEASSGNVMLHRVGPVDFTLRSGDINVTEARGEVRATTTSGNIEVVDATGPVRLRASSGNIDARRLAAGADAEATSGNVTVELDKPAAARLHASSGDVDLTVPEGRYRVRADARSGDTNLAVPNDPGASLLLDVSANSGNVTLNLR
jgi:Putative adhesin